MSKDHLAHMIQDSARAHGARPAMRFKDAGAWRSISYAALGERIRTAAKALIASGIERGDLVGLFARNAPEWAIADFAILSAGAVSVPIYATDTARQAQHLANDAGLKLLFVGDGAQSEKVEAFRAQAPALRSVVVFDPAAPLPGAEAVHLEDFLRRGEGPALDAELEARLAAADPGDVATVIYTSGTTGDPRGAVLTHANLFQQFRALDERFQVGMEDRSLCFLPLSHAYERTWSYYVFRQGAENAYLSDPRDVVATLPQVRPTVMVSVPRLYQKICAAVQERVARGPALRRALFRWALRVGGAYESRRRTGRVGPLLALGHRLADALVLSKIRAVVGGEKNFFSSGGAPLAQEVEEFFFAAGLLVCQGYGLTETAPMLTCNSPGAFRFGTVGRPILGCELRIAPGTGEIQARGGNVMRGYHGKPAETAAAFEDGWFKTGDVGELDADGYLRVTDRIKDLIITSGGKNIAPQHLEGLFGSDPYVEQLAVIGDRRPYVTALVVPAFPALEQHAREHGIAFSSREELVSRPEIVGLYERRIRAACADLARYERIERFTLLPGEFTQDGGELTPTLKIRRRFVEQKYRPLIEAMYARAAGAPAQPAR